MKNCFIVENEEGKRIDRYLAEQMPDMSRSYIQKIIKDGLVTVSEKPVKANYRLSLYESIKVTIPELKEPEIEAEDIPLDILYEDQDIIVINKPKGMVVHPAPGHYSGTLVNALMYHCGNELSGINGVMRPGIVHQLPHLRAFFCRHIFHALQHFRKGAFLSKGIHPDLIELIKGSCGLHLFPDLFLDLFQSVLHNKLLPVLNRSAADKLWGFVLFCGFTDTKKSPA